MIVNEYHLYCSGRTGLAPITVVLLGLDVEDAAGQADRVIKSIAPAGYRAFQLHVREKDNPDDYRLIREFSAAAEMVVTVR